MSTEAKNPNGHAPLRPVPLCHRLLAAPAGVDRSCVGSACSMWRERRPGVGYCREVFATIRQAPLWPDPAQDAPEPAAVPAEAPVEPEPVGLVRALGDSEERLAKVLQELETTRVALAEAEAELERLGSTRAVSYEYQIKWES